MAIEFARVRALFEAALDLAPEQRDPYLRRECGDDAALHDEVARLLASDTSTSPMARALDGNACAAGHAPEPMLDATIAGYRLVRVLGSGGMGTVYVAEQLEPRRQVALKVLALGLRNPAAIARFRFEAELLGRLRHPGVAQVHASGVHRQGDVELPWFALELVPDAVALDEFARRRGLSWRARLALVLQACDAVHHAHLHGIVHRDLKPQNVLVDPEGRVKVIDFGIARSSHGHDALPPTEPGQVYGTLAYMSPEQLAGGNVDHRADVWALGVLTFELLAERRPFPVEKGRPWRDTERLLLAPPPRLGSSATGLPPDLDAVLAMALRSDPSARYESAAALATDLRAVLAARPVVARAPSTLYHLRLFVRRRAGVVAALAAIAVVIVGAVALLAVQNVRLQREQRQSQRIARFARDFLVAADERQGHGADYTVRAALDQATAALEHETFPDPLVEAELRLLIADAYRGLSAAGAAIAQYERAATLFANAAGGDDPRTFATQLSLASTRCDTDAVAEADAELAALLPRVRAALPTDHPIALKALHERAFVWRAAGRFAEAEAGYRELLAARERGLGEGHADTLVTQHNLGTLLLAMARPQEAHDVLADCLERSRRAHEPDTSTWQIADSLAEAKAALGDLAGAAAMHREIRAGYERLLGPDHALTLGCAFHLLKVLHASGDRAGMRDLALDLLPRCERTFGRDHRRTMDVLAAVALAKMQAGDAAGALADMARAYDAQQRNLGLAHTDTFVAGNNLAEAQLELGAPGPALATTTTLAERLAAAPDVPAVRVGYTRFLHARALAANGRPAEAREEAAAARTLLEANLPSDHAIVQRLREFTRKLAGARTGG
ncbi:MAG: serine/threonine protein kinase [Planctomycetes bacterium]|nr:serine/threonine protein kinase [Planctomycetota bacterium]